MLNNCLPCGKNKAGQQQLFHGQKRYKTRYANTIVKQESIVYFLYIVFCHVMSTHKYFCDCVIKKTKYIQVISFG